MTAPNVCPTCGRGGPQKNPFTLVVTGQNEPGRAPRLETAWAAINSAVAKNPGIATTTLATALDAIDIARPNTVGGLIRAAVRTKRLRREYRRDGTPLRRRAYLYPPKENP